MNKKHLLFIFVLISMVSVLFADENLDKQLENGVFNIKDWNLAFIRESNPSLMLARLYQSYNRVFVKKHGRNKDLEQFIKEKMPLESQKALWENLLWQNNFNEYLSECIANEITSEEYDNAHYLADLDFILNPANAENPEKILEYADRAMKYKDIDSAVLLKKTLELVIQNNARIGNIDINVICQAPKLAPYILAIRENISKLTGVALNRVSVKAKTKEKVDAVGKGKAVEVFCSVLLYKD